MKKVSTLIGIIILVVAAIILVGGVLTYQYFVAKMPTIESPSQNQKNQTNSKVFNQIPGVTFLYPTVWGNVIESQGDDGTGSVQNSFNFTLNNNVNDSMEVYEIKKSFDAEVNNSYRPFFQDQGKDLTYSTVNGKRAASYVTGCADAKCGDVFEFIDLGSNRIIEFNHIFSGDPTNRFGQKDTTIDTLTATIQFTK